MGEDEAASLQEHKVCLLMFDELIELVRFL